MSGLIVCYMNHLPHIAPDAFVGANATIIGKVAILARANIWFGCVLCGDIAAIHVGAATNIQDATVVHVSGKAGGETWIGEGHGRPHGAHPCVPA